ncbi:MAG TPA: hypothetical protein DCF63_18645 [Planctomycetaceae bacterium]|nr:hypothetical protein [Planctomycetaceae bacterium]
MNLDLLPPKHSAARSRSPLVKPPLPLLTTCGSSCTQVISASELTDEILTDWDVIRASWPGYRSPFFSHQYLQAVARHCEGIQVALVKNSGRVVAILPFQRLSRRRARPAGAGVNDAHGILALPNSAVSPCDLLRAAGLSSYAFHAAPEQNLGVAEHKLGVVRSFLADLKVDPQGYDHYLLKNSYTVSRQPQKTRRMIRELGPLKFDFDCYDASLLEYLIRLKCEQYSRTHNFQILGVPWIGAMMLDLLCQRDSTVRGVLSVMLCGQQPVAMHFGMAEGDLLHYWFPVYNLKYSVMSPGTQLFLEVCRAATDRGYSAIDMGFGEQDYKVKLTNVVSQMNYGIITSSALRRIAHQSCLAFKSYWRNSPLKGYIKPVIRKLRPNFGGNQY